MPVLYTDRDIDNIPRTKFLRFFSFFLKIPTPCDTDQNLPAAFIRMVDMPAIAASQQLKRHIEDANLLGRERRKAAFALLISSRISCRSNSTASVT